MGGDQMLNFNCTAKAICLTLIQSNSTTFKINRYFM